MDHQHKNVDLHLHRQQWCERDFVSQRRWKVETFELPHFVATRDGGNGRLKLCSISGHQNPADIGAKRLASPRMKSLMVLLGLYNRSTGWLGGADDPGRVFVRRVGSRALASTLSLIQLICKDVIHFLKVVATSSF